MALLPRHTRVAGLCVLIAWACLPAVASGVLPSDAERAALAQLRGKLVGQIVWESNRTGHWELYAMNADGAGARRLTHLAKDGDARAYSSYLRPRLSPDGTQIVFGYGKQHAPAEVWLVSSRGGDARKLTVGNPLNWTADSKAILLVRDSHLFRYELATGKEARVHPVKLPTDGRSGSMVGAVRADLKAGVFRTARRNEYFLFDEAKVAKTMGGCEPAFSADGRFLYWVQGPKDFRVWEIATNHERQLLGQPPVQPYNYTYCPAVSRDGRWLLYGASPDQHDHTTSDYEIYLQELKDFQPLGKPIRLTFNSRCDRWANLFVAAPGSPNPLPDGPPDIAGNTQTNPPPPRMWIYTCADKDLEPDIGGEWGTWTTNDTCTAVVTFLPGEDAPQGAGGAVQIDYRLGGEPHGVSLWIAPPGGRLNLAGYDRFVIWARGNVSAFSVVAKDGTAEESLSPKGIADYVIRGVTGRWQRFELPFKNFVHRVKGQKLNWQDISLLAIALERPHAAPEGSLHIDNLQALPPGWKQEAAKVNLRGYQHRLVWQARRNDIGVRYVRRADAVAVR